MYDFTILHLIFSIVLFPYLLFVRRCLVELLKNIEWPLFFIFIALSSFNLYINKKADKKSIGYESNIKQIF